jgi:hypothetical protein
MIKKIATATSLLALSSFAAWDRFPVLDAGKGQVKVGVSDAFSTESDVNGYSLYLNTQARYTVVPNLELAAIVPYRLGKDAENYGSMGLDRPIVSLRYWIPANIGVYADFSLPVGSEDVTDKHISITPGLQFATDVSPTIAVAAEASYIINLEKDDEKDGNELWVGAEADFKAGNATPWVGLDFVMLGDSESAGESFSPEDDNGFFLSAGSSLSITPMLGVDASVSYGLSGYGEKALGLEGNIVASF